MKLPEALLRLPVIISLYCIPPCLPRPDTVARVPLCYVVIGGHIGAIPAIRQAVMDNFPVMILKVLLPLALSKMGSPRPKVFICPGNS